MDENLNNLEEFEENQMEADEEIVSKINDPTFPLNIFKKLFENELLVDVTLIAVADSTSVSANRMVLATASEYFSTMFATDFMEKNQKKIKIKEVTGESLKSLVKYCYTGQIEINSTNVLDLLASASMMRFGKIEDECRKFLEKKLKAQPKSSFNIHLIAQKYSFTELARNSLKNICENFDIFSKMPEFNEIDFSFMERILNSEEWFNATEEEVFEAAMKWVDFDRSERQQFVPNILKLIRLTQIHPTYLFENIRPICESNNCAELAVTALYWQALPEPQRMELLPLRETIKRTGTPQMLIIGGNGSSDIISMESYCPRSQKWASRNSIKCPTNINSIQLVVIDKTVYATGNTVFCFDLHTLKLSHLAPMSVARNSHGVAVINEDLYVIGGLNGNVRLSSVERYDIRENEWKTCKPMLKAKSSMGVAVLNDYLYVVGGHDGSINRKLVERYSTSNKTWSYVKPMNNHREDPSVGVLNGKIYAIGGYDGNVLDSVEYYDPITNIWTTIASLSTPRLGITVAVYENEIFAIGGFSNGGARSSVVERYDANKNKWITIEPMTCGRSNSVVTIIRSN